MVAGRQPGLTLVAAAPRSRRPVYQVAHDGAIWRTSLMAQRPGDGAHQTSAPHVVDCEAWGTRRNGIRRHAAGAAGRRR